MLDARRQPHEIFLLLLTVMSGMVGLLNGVRAEDFAAEFPPWLQACWFGGLIFGSVVALVGAAMSGIRGLFVERAGLVVLTFLCLSFGISAIPIIRAGLGWVSFGAVILYGLTCAVRASQIKTQAVQRAAFDLQREMK